MPSSRGLRADGMRRRSRNHRNGTAKFDGTHNGTGKLSLGSGTVSGVGTATFSAIDWTGGAVNANVTSNGTANITGGA